MDASARTRVSESVPDPFIGQTIEGHRVEEVIGRGGMGTVYRTTQVSLGRRAALKILPADLAQDRQFVQRFHREAEALSRLSHPNIVTVFDRGEVAGRPFLAMEYVEGPSLREVLRRGPLRPGDALRHVSAVLSALQHAHGKGVIHRDIKPENVMLAGGEIVKVADFGLSRLLGPAETTRLTRTHFSMGTYEYMSPEQRERAKEADERSDLFATGVILYEMLTGELPIGRFDLPSRRRPSECDRRIDAVIERSLEKDPDRRYQHASEMADAVSAILDRPSRGRRVVPPPSADAARLENHIDNLATIDYVLGTLCHLIGFAVLFGAIRMRAAFGMPFFLFFFVGWYLRSTASDLREFKPAARTAQALIALASGATMLLLPFAAYSFWVLFGHRRRSYYEARARGLDATEAARFTHQAFDVGPPPPGPMARNAGDGPPRAEAGSRSAPPSPADRSVGTPLRSAPPSPPDIHLQSVVVSHVGPAPRRRRVARAIWSLVVTAGVVLLIIYLTRAV